MWWCCAPRVRAARSQCTSLFYADGGRREHDHCKAQGRLCDTSLLSLTGVIMPSSRPFLVDLPRVAREGPEAIPLTSHASTFWLSPSADSQTRNSLKVSQPCGLKKRPLVQQTSSGPAVTWRTVNELLPQSPLCQVGCATSPATLTILSIAR